MKEELWIVTFLRLIFGINPPNYIDGSKMMSLRTFDDSYEARLKKVFSTKLLTNKQKNVLQKWSFYSLRMCQSYQSLIGGYYDNDVRSDSISEIRGYMFIMVFGRLLTMVAIVAVIFIIYSAL